MPAPLKSFLCRSPRLAPLRTRLVRRTLTALRCSRLVGVGAVVAVVVGMMVTVVRLVTTATTLALVGRRGQLALPAPLLRLRQPWHHRPALTPC